MRFPTKWEELKMKTISDDDLYLNPQLKASDVDIPCYFDPAMPSPGLQKSNPKLYQKLLKRAEFRRQEYLALANEVELLRYSGQIRIERGVVIDARTGTPIGGDYDPWEISVNGVR